MFFGLIKAPKIVEEVQVYEEPKILHSFRVTPFRDFVDLANPDEEITMLSIPRCMLPDDVKICHILSGPTNTSKKLTRLHDHNDSTFNYHLNGFIVQLCKSEFLNYFEYPPDEIHFTYTM